MAHIKIDAALASDEECLACFSRLRILLPAQAGVAVRVDISRPKLGSKQIVKRPLDAARAVIDHDRNVCYVASDHGLLVWLPFRTGKVRALDADNHAGIP